MAKRLTHEHSHMKKFQELCNKADELGIRVEFMGTRTLVYLNEQEYDLEDPDSPYEALSTFPPTTECVLILDR